TVAFDMGCLNDHKRGTRMRHHAKMHQVPVVGATIVAGILTHGRHDDAVRKLETGKAKGREQATGHEFDLARGGKSAPISTLLDGHQIADDGAGVTRGSAANRLPARSAQRAATRSVSRKYAPNCSSE